MKKGVVQSKKETAEMNSLTRELEVQCCEELERMQKTVSVVGITIVEVTI